MNFSPLHDRIVVSRVGSAEKTAGGIVMPGAAKEKPWEGNVIAVGPEKPDKDSKRISMDVCPLGGS